MRAAIVFIEIVLLLGCSAAAQQNRPVIRSAPPKHAVDETAQILDVVIRDWLGHGPDHGDRRPKFAVLLGANLPAGYKPQRGDWTVIRVAETDGRFPPTQLRAGEVEYDLDYHSSYVQRKQDLREVRVGDPPPPAPPTQIIHVDEPTVLRIDAVRLDGDRAEVEISQNRHHNLGGSGTTYKLVRTREGWRVVPEKRVQWMN